MQSNTCSSHFRLYTYRPLPEPNLPHLEPISAQPHQNLIVALLIKSPCGSPWVEASARISWSLPRILSPMHFLINAHLRPLVMKEWHWLFSPYWLFFIRKTKLYSLLFVNYCIQIQWNAYFLTPGLFLHLADFFLTCCFHLNSSKICRSNVVLDILLKCTDKWPALHKYSELSLVRLHLIRKSRCPTGVSWNRITEL